MKKIILLISLFFLNLFLSAQEKKSILYFSPEGVVKNIKQVKVGFAKQMVPFGNPRTKTDQFQIDCPVLGKARWIDEKTFVYEFPNVLEAGIICKFTLKSEIKTLDGKDLVGKKTFSFSTGGPAVLSSNPYEGSTIDEDQLLFLTVDSELDTESLKGKIYFESEGIKDKIPAEILDPSNYKEVVKSSFPSKPDFKKLVLIKSSRRFANKIKVGLIWAKGIKSKSGVSTEADQVFHFITRENFTADFSCERENAKASCLPLTNFYVNFSAPISKSDVKKISLVGNGKTYKAVIKTGAETEEESDNTVYRVFFEGPFPAESKFTLNISADLKDDAGRKLANAKKFPLEVKTDAYPPLAKFSGDFGIIELEAEPLLPVTLRNLDKQIKSRIIRMVKDEGFFDKVLGQKAKITPDKILYWLKKISKAKRDQSIFAGDNSSGRFAIPKPNGEKAFEVVGIPLKEAGFYVLEIESEKLGNSLLEKGGSLYVPTSALVTNMAVHFKEGKENSLVWVTALNSAAPIANAKLSIRDCKNTVLAEGLSNANGIWIYKGPLKTPNCSYNTYDNGLLVVAEKENDLSFVHTSWKDGIENWRFNLSGYSGEDNKIAHTIFDRTLFRAGETVSMKHLLRRHSMSGIGFPESVEYPATAKIRHQGTNQEFSFPLKWTSGFAEMKWKIPKEAKLGNYSVELFSKSRTFYTGNFNVEEFKIPKMKAIVKSPLEKLVNAKNFTVDIIINYLSGGPAAGLSVKLRTLQSIDSYISFPDFEDYLFSSKQIKVGIEKSSYSDEEFTANTASEESTSNEFVLDKDGFVKANIAIKKSEPMIQSVQTEVEYRDSMGEIQTASAYTKIFPSKYLVGLRNDSWSMPKEEVKAVAVVVDLDGKPKSGIQVEIGLYQKSFKSERKRLVGGFYSYDSHTEIKKIGNFCSGKTDNKGNFSCLKASPVAGNIILQAEISDGDGNISYSNKEIYVGGKDLWFDVADHDRIDLIPDKKSYEPGDIAKFQVRAPFKNATVLVTVEREGIIEHFVKQINSAKPEIEVPIKQSYAPNVFISALVVRGRVGDVKPTSLIDLGRPSYRLGVLGIKVGWKGHELKVGVKVDRPVYKIREKVTATISIKTANGAKLPANSDFAIAVVDEGLLELMPNNSWNVLSAMMNERSLDVQTSTAQMQVVGRRHYGIKALIPGGGGGADSASREMFDTILFWKASVKLDSEGLAEIQFPINDSISSFRVVAIATSGEKFFGTGSVNFRTNQDLIIEPTLPQLAREGDILKPSITIRNTSTADMDVEVSGTIAGIKNLPSQTVKVEKDKQVEVAWDFTVPFNIEKLDYEFTAKAGVGTLDRLKFSQKVVPAIPVRVLQGTLMQLDKEHSMKVELPEGANPERGGIEVTYSRSLLENLGSLKEHMKKYPYTCLEQQTSKAIVLKDKKAFEKLMEVLPSYLDYDGFAKYFPSTYEGSPILTAYLLAIANEANYAIPENSKTLMLNALGNFVDGKVYRQSSLPTADLTIRKINTLEALSRYGKISLPSLNTLSMDLNLLPTSAVLDWWNILSRTSNIPNRAAQLEKTEQILRTRLNLQGTTMKFANEQNDNLWWLMTSADMNATKLLLAIVSFNKWREDAPRIVRGTLSRQRNGVWDLTTANAWGSLALEKFSKEYEKEAITGESISSISDATKKLDWSKSKSGESYLLPFPKSQAALKLNHEGSGKPWVRILSKAALPLKSAVSNGYTIEKSISILDDRGVFGLFKGGFKRGDLVRVTLKIKADSDMTWAVVNDPIPTGAAILGGFRKDSSIANSGQASSGGYPTFEERSYESYRAYYEFLPEGETIIEYTIRLNQDGKFLLPPTRVEAMYSPDMYGEFPNQEYDIVK